MTILFVNYVCTSGKHYPLEFRRFQSAAMRGHGRNLPGPHAVVLPTDRLGLRTKENSGVFAFDSYFTNAENLNHIHSKQDKDAHPRGYVGDLKFNRKLEWKGKEIARPTPWRR